MGRPPAKALPFAAVWQATQSPARARYSPRVMTRVAAVAAAAALAAVVDSALGLVLAGRAPGRNTNTAPIAAAASTTAARKMRIAMIMRDYLC
jgi:hypothetical protein